MLNEFLYLLISIPGIYKGWLEPTTWDLMPLIIPLTLTALMLLEFFRVNRHQSRSTLTRSYLTNIGTFAFNNLVLSILSVSSLLALAAEYHYDGLLASYIQPVQVLISFIMFDLVLYIWHRANHDFDSLWMFHKVHHSDKSMNVSTAFRVHFIELLLTTLVKAMYIIITGVEVAVVALVEGVSTLFIMYHHFNTPLRNDKWIQWIFIVPSLHRVHHSTERQHHDSNYGAIFSLWDRIFGTMKGAIPVEIGLANLKALNFYELLRFGLITGNHNPAPLQVSTTTQELSSEFCNEMIAEAAYYKAEKRGFAPGYDYLDWLEAEKQIREFSCAA